MSGPGERERTERTMRVKAPAFHTSGKAWRDFRFDNLEKVSRAQMLLFKRLEWLLPGMAPTGQVTEEVQARLKALFDEEAVMGIDYVHVVPPKALRRYVGSPTFLAVIAPLPHKTRGFLEVELSLAHAVIDMLLGGAGEMVSLRPLTDIEEGVMSYVLLEGLKALAPGVEPGLPRLRLEGLCHGIDEALGLLGDESQIAVVQLKCLIGSQSGYLRLFIPATVLGMTNPPQEGAARQARRSADLQQHFDRLSLVQAEVRAEIGWARIAAGDLASLRSGDVVLLDELIARPDQGEGGAARLKVGRGTAGFAEAEVVVEDGRFLATLTAFHLGAAPTTEAAPEAAEQGEDAPVEEPSPAESGEGAELLNDIPLQIAVELARVPASAEEIVSLKVGQVIDLNKLPGEPVELSVNGKVVARGELVEVEGHLGVRVLSLA